MQGTLRPRLRAVLIGAVVAMLAAGVAASPIADAHPDPMNKDHHRQTSGVVVRVEGPEALAGDLAAVHWSGSGPVEDQAAPLVYAGNGCTLLSYANIDVSGAIALIDSDDASTPCPVATFVQQVQSAEQAGAIGLVAVPATGEEPANANAVSASIPALEVFRTEQVEAVLAAAVAGETVDVVLTDTREPLDALGATACVDGMAGPFPCDGIDLLSYTPKATFGEGDISDIWGWTDPESGDEYVMFGKTDGVGFMRVTDPTDPVYLGALPNPAVLQEVWHDIKVYEDHAFIVSESTPHGMTIFDLTRLRDVTEAQEWDADAVYPFNVSAHNIAINEETGYAYIVGGSAALVAPDQCLSGLHMVDINEPQNPVFAGCYLVDGGPGTAARSAGLPEGAAYVHDTQCVNYHGPDERYTGRELCFNAAEDQVTIADVTDKLMPATVGTTDYEGIAYAHQGWLTEDHRYLLTNDELDETTNGTNTRTVVLDVSDLENPVVAGIHTHETKSIDHNNYVHQGRVYQSNYTSGLRVLELDGVGQGALTPFAYFDTYPYSEDATFDGTWSNYPYFASGTIAVSAIGEGIFLVKLAEEAGDGGDGGDGDAGGPGKGNGTGQPDHAGPKDGRGPKG